MRLQSQFPLIHHILLIDELSVLNCSLITWAASHERLVVLQGLYDEQNDEEEDTADGQKDDGGQGYLSVVYLHRVWVILPYSVYVFAAQVYQPLAESKGRVQSEYPGQCSS